MMSCGLGLLDGVRRPDNALPFEENYYLVQDFIDEWHGIAKHALAEDVEVDKRVGRGDNGLYHEPLESALGYLGLHIEKNVMLNDTLDVWYKDLDDYPGYPDSSKASSFTFRALIGGNPTNANHWYETYMRGKCSSCGKRSTGLKRCICQAVQYCNIECQRNDWANHKNAHKAIVQLKKEEDQARLKKALVLSEAVSRQAFYLCQGREVQELKRLLQAHPGVSVNDFKDPQASAHATHLAAMHNYHDCLRLLLDAKASLETGMQKERTPLLAASSTGAVDCARMLIASKANVNAVDCEGTTPISFASNKGHIEILKMLIDAKGDVTIADLANTTPVMNACSEDRLECLQLLLDAKGDIHAKSGAAESRYVAQKGMSTYGLGALYGAFVASGDASQRSEPGMPFAVLCCNTDIADSGVGPSSNTVNEGSNRRAVSRATVRAHVEDFKCIHDFIDECHTVTMHALTKDVEVDTRVGDLSNGLSFVPAALVLRYLGLSVKKDQTVNKSIDGKSKKRALVPGHPTNANIWFKLYHHTRNQAFEIKINNVISNNNKSQKKKNKPRKKKKRGK